MRISTLSIMTCLGFWLSNETASAQQPVSITGTVWQDKSPFDGIHQPAEKVVSAVLVKLLDASNGKVVGTTISRNDGGFLIEASTPGTYVLEYAFPTLGFSPTAKRQGSDNAVNSAANPSGYSDPITVDGTSQTLTYSLGLVPKENTLTYCTMKEPTVTIWKDDLILPKSTVSAMPTGVSIFASEAVWHPTIGIENLGTADVFDIAVQGIITMALPKSQMLKANSDIPKSGTLPAYDGTQDYAGNSGITWLNEFSFATGRYDYPPFLIDNSLYGSGTFSLSTESKSGVTIVGSGNQQTLVQTHVSAGACVVYTYAEGALPITLVAFAAQQETGAVHLSWQTSEEKNSSHFVVEASADGRSFTAIGQVEAAHESPVRTHYTFTDTAPLAPSTYYRLKMVDTDETFAYSKIIVARTGNAPSFSVFPNPAVNLLTVRADQHTEAAKIQLFNSDSSLMLEAVNSNTIDVSKQKPGPYVLRVVDSNGQTHSQQVLISR